jgi:hypothetical protein
VCPALAAQLNVRSKIENQSFGGIMYKTILFIVLIIANISAKRAQPPQINPIVKDSVQYYTIPHSELFYVNGHAKEYYEKRHKKYLKDQMSDYELVAWDMRKQKTLWTLVIYSIKINDKIEGDIQDICISEMQYKDGKLIIENESNDSFIVDLKTKSITPANKVYKKMKLK